MMLMFTAVPPHDAEGNWAHPHLLHDLIHTEHLHNELRPLELCLLYEHAELSMVLLPCLQLDL